MKKLNFLFLITFFIIFYAFVGVVITLEGATSFKIITGLFLICYFALLCYANNWSLPWKGRGFSKAFPLGLNIFLMMAIISMVNYMGHQHQTYGDLTKQKINNLTSYSNEILRKIDAPLKMKVFAKKSNWGAVSDLVYLYKSKQPYIDHEIISVDERPDLVQKYNIQQLPTVVYSYKGKNLIGNQFNEASISKKIATLQGAGSKRICWLTGTGGPSPLADERNGGSYLKEQIMNEGHQLVLTDKYNDKCDAYLVIGFKAKDNESLDLLKKIKSEKSLVMAIDPDLKGRTNPRVWDLFKEDGITINNHIVVDQNSQKETGQAINLQLEHNGNRILYPLSTSFKFNTDKVKGLLYSSKFPYSWSESNLNDLISSSRVNFTSGEDDRGPVALAGILENGSRKVALLGTSLFLSNAYASYANNFHFFLNLLGTVLGEDTNAFSRPELKAEQIIISTSQFNLVIYLSLVIAPLSFLLIAFYNYRQRKKS